MQFRNLLLTSGFLLLTCLHAWADTEPDNNTHTGADVLVEGDTVAGAVSGGDSEDWYQLVTTNDGTIALSLDFTGLAGQYVNFRMYDSDGATILTGAGTDYDYTGTGATVYSISQRAAGTYYVRIYMGFAGSYVLSNEIITPAAANDAEPNDTPASALTITEGGSVTGHIKFKSNGGAVDAEDYYQLTTTQDGTISLSLEYEGPEANYTYFYLYDSDGTTFLPSVGNDYDYGTPGATVQTISGLAAGTYYINVDDGSFAGGYVLSASVITDGITNDVEPNGTAATALTIAEGGTVSGHIRYRLNGGSNDAEDYYQLTTTQDGTISLSLEYIGSTSGYAYCYLYDSDGTTFLPSAGTDYDYGTAGATIQTIAGLAAGTYYINIDDGNLAGGYILTANVITDGVTNDVEPNNTPATALTIAEGGNVSGHIRFRVNGGGFDEDDYYQLTTTQDGTISLSLEYIGLNSNYAYFYLYDSDGTTFLAGAGTDYDYGTTGATTQTIAGLAAGTYYVRVNDGNFAGGYILSASVITDGIPNDAEPNDVMATAIPIETNSTVQGHIDYRNNGGSHDEDDYYQIELNSAGAMTMSLEIASTNAGQYTYFYLYNEGGTYIGGGTNYDYGTPGATTQHYASLAAGIYYLNVHNGNAATGYTLTNTYCPDAITIIAEGETTFCEGESVTLSTEDHHLSYLWSDGSITETNTVTLSGDHYLTIDNGGGCVRISNTITVESTPLPVAAIMTDGPEEFCAGGDVILSVDATPDSYNWSNGETTSTITVTETGDYSVELEKNGCTAISDPIHIEVNANPIAVITPDGATEFCDGGSVTLNASPAGDYLWSDGSTGSSVVADATNTYSVTVTDANGCSDMSETINVTENANPTAGISADGPTEFCSGESVNLMASGGATYLWSTGATTSTINVMTGGDYSVTVFSAEGCSDMSDMISVTVSVCEDLVIVAEGPTEFCSDGSVTLTSSEISGNVWSTGETTQSIIVTTSGDYYCENAGDMSNMITVTVTAIPSISISSPSTLICYEGSVELTATTDGFNLQWQHDGIDIPGATGTVYNATINGKYTCTASNGICNTVSGTIKLKYAERVATTPSGTAALCGPTLNMSVPAIPGSTYQWYQNNAAIAGATSNTYTTSTIGKFYCLITNAGCTRASKLLTVSECRLADAGNEFVVYPNPASEAFAVEYSVATAGNISIWISDITGRIIQAENKTVDAGTYVDMFGGEQFIPGMYIITLTGTDGKTAQQKLVIEK